VGATVLQSLAFEVEQAGRASDGQAAKALAIALVEAFKAAQSELAALETNGEPS
jgi:hypothetical protein